LYFFVMKVILSKASKLHKEHHLHLQNFTEKLSKTLSNQD
jgi:hypothetical protein